MNPLIPPRRIFGIEVDERLLDHRRRSSMLGMMAGAVVSGGLFEYHLIREHRCEWELFSVLMAMVVVKLGALAWYRFNR
jgi:hypothetical protein